MVRSIKTLHTANKELEKVNDINHKKKIIHTSHLEGKKWD